jgi:dipeptidyl aminopeptidase/acylaminoacyl peptidase
LFSLLSEASLATSPPVLAFKEAAVSDVQWPGDSKLLISSNNFIKNSLLFSADPSAAPGSNATLGIFLLSANMKNGTTFALSRIQVSEFFYQGDGDYLAHAWIIKPSFLREIATYPFVFCIYGGPQGSTHWLDRLRTVSY